MPLRVPPVLAPAVTPILRALNAGPLVADPAVFARPLGAPALSDPDSLVWRVFSNPVAMFAGGVAAVLLELGEPRVRHGVWDHSAFARDPIGRLNRTGHAAMVTAFAPVAAVERLTNRVNAWHRRITGVTPDGQPYRADDPELLRWVQTTAAWSFLAAWERLGGRASSVERDRYYADGAAGARLFGVAEPVTTEAEADRMLADWTGRLTPSPILHQLLGILHAAPIVPRPLRPFQRAGLRLAVDLLPPAVRGRLELGRWGGAGAGEGVLRALAAVAATVELPGTPVALARTRVGKAPRTRPPLSSRAD